MLTISQLQANQKNAQLSTGPITYEGKAKASLNSLKHSIFSKDILAQEDEEASLSYEEHRQGIFESLQPYNQLQATLTEKVAVDFWRLRKVLRFEAGSIAQEQRSVNKMGFSCSYDEENRLKEKIEGLRDELSDGRRTLSKVSRKGFKGKQQGEPILSIIYRAAYDMYYESLEEEDLQDLRSNDIQYHKLIKILGVTESRFIKDLKDYFEQRIPELEDRIEKQQWALDDFYRTREIKRSVAALPSTENIDKLLKYERSIQRSILHNIAILHKLQGFG